MIGVWLTGVLSEKPLRQVTLTSLSIFFLLTITLATFPHNRQLVVAMAGLWGLSYGGAGTLIQMASSSVAGEGIDIASAMISTVWNSSIALAGIVGGAVLTHFGPTAIPLSMLPVIGCGILIISRARLGAFAR